MRIATWNVNHTAGEKFRLDAARAAVGLDADVLVLNEYCPTPADHARFGDLLQEAGWQYQHVSRQPAVKANRVLVAARTQVLAEDLPALPMFDAAVEARVPGLGEKLAAGMILVRVPALRLRVLGGRVPYVRGKPAIACWTWLEAIATQLVAGPALIVGDLNVGLDSPAEKGADQFRRILNSGWTRAAPDGQGSCFRPKGVSEIDHLLASPGAALANARYVRELWTGEARFHLAGGRGALSDHAAVVAEVAVTPEGGGTPAASP